MVVCVLPSARKDLYDCIKKLCLHISMVVRVLPSARKDLYDCIKKLCCIERPGMLMLPATCTSTEFVLILHYLHLHYTTNHSSQSVNQSINQ